MKTRFIPYALSRKAPKALHVALLVLAHTAVSQAAVTQTTTTSATFNGQTPSNIDLLQMAGVTATLGGTYTGIAAGFGTPTSTVLRDGSAGGSTINSSDYGGSVCEGSTENPQYTVTFDLDLTGAAFGYDLQSIASFSGWVDARAGQVYKIYYSTTANGDFTQLLSGLNVQSTLNAFGATASNNGLKVAITDTTGTIVRNVDAIRFEILPGAGNGTNYREFDVIGIASVPEPSVALLGGLGLLALLRRRR